MHDLIPLDPIPPGALTTAEIDATMAYAEAEKAEATRAAYASDWRQFAIWCHATAATPLPAHAGIVGGYLAHLAQSGLRASSIGRKAAAIGYRHRLAGHEPPTNGEGVRAVLRGIRRTIGTARAAKTAATAPVLRKMLDAMGERLIDARDRALLSFGLASAMRRSELAALEVADLTEAPDGLHVLIRRSKTDQEGAGQTIAVPRGAKLRPVEAMQTWLARAESTPAPCSATSRSATGSARR